MKVHQKYFKIESLMKKVITLKYSGLKKNAFSIQNLRTLIQMINICILFTK